MSRERLGEFSVLLNEVKDGLKELISEFGSEGITWQPLIPETNSAAVLITHMLGSEAGSIHGFIGGDEVNRDRDSEFSSPVTDIDGLLELVERVRTRTNDVLDLEPDELLFRPISTREPDHTSTVSRTLMGVLMHQAEHVGHLGLTLQLFREDKTED